MQVFDKNLYFQDNYFKGRWNGFSQASEAITTWNTGIEFDQLTYIGTKSVQYPENFVRFAPHYK